MSYRMKVKELVKYSRLPNWCLEIMAAVKEAWQGVNTDRPDLAIATISTGIEAMTFTGISADRFSGAVVPRVEFDGGRALTIYSRTGNTALVEFCFEEVG